ncbi:MAG TPA: RNB domain-containing ribonuclease [Anaerolineaceae bacterium]
MPQDQDLKPNSLLLYKNRPARLAQAGERLEIDLGGGETARVRPKDVILLHPGPLASLEALKPQPGEVEAAWEILAGAHTHLAELAELTYGVFTPASAWAAWQQVIQGDYFEGTPDDIRARTAEEVARRRQERAAAEAHQRAYQAFIDRTRQGIWDPADRDFLRDVENLAYGRGSRSVVLRDLGRAETAENAHALLLELGVWDEQVDPYPARQGFTIRQLDLPVPDLPAENRRDLTHLPALAIDDAGTDTPDDALSFEPDAAGGGRLWVHVADVAALVSPGSPLDGEARARGETLHLPEGAVHLLPKEVTLKLGLGLQERSPALSFGMDLTAAGEVAGMEIVPSWVRVTRLTYESAETVIEQEPLRALERLTTRVRQRRLANGAVMIDFPEAKIHVEDGKVILYPLPNLRSRAVVEESMILAGSETARFASERGLHLAFSQQEAVETRERPVTLAEMFAFRRLLKRSQYKITPGAHGGLGVAAYAQVTSPLRRYLDLVGHQQLRAFLKGAPLLSETDLLERIGSVEAVSGAIRQAEIASERHWTMVYLMQQPGWRGGGMVIPGILVEKRGPNGVVIIPSLALETRVHLPHDLPLDSRLSLALMNVNLPQREASFKVDV